MLTYRACHADCVLFVSHAVDSLCTCHVIDNAPGGGAQLTCKKDVVASKLPVPFEGVARTYKQQSE
jgi:hypothetical protein